MATSHRGKENTRAREHERWKWKNLEASHFTLTIGENSRRCYLDRVNDADVVQHGNPVAVALCVVNERSYVDAFWWIANTWAHRHGDVFIVILIVRLIQIVSQSGSVVERDEYAFAQIPWTLNPTDKRLKDCLNVPGEAPQTRWDVAVMKRKSND